MLWRQITIYQGMTRRTIQGLNSPKIPIPSNNSPNTPVPENKQKQNCSAVWQTLALGFGRHDDQDLPERAKPQALGKLSKK
jgi:hypothetical protein